MAIIVDYRMSRMNKYIIKPSPQDFNVDNPLQAQRSLGKNKTGALSELRNGSGFSFHRNESLGRKELVASLFCMPLGMHPDRHRRKDKKLVAFLRNAGKGMERFFLPSDTFLTECNQKHNDKGWRSLCADVLDCRATLAMTKERLTTTSAIVRDCFGRSSLAMTAYGCCFPLSALHPFAL
jgi:hypothetical protein